jgi:hypothetical protein
MLNGNWGSSPGVKEPGLEINHLISSSTEVKNEWSFTSAPSVYLHGVDRENFNFYLSPQ